MIFDSPEEVTSLEGTMCLPQLRTGGKEEYGGKEG